MQINVKLSPDVLDWVMAHIQQENVPRDVVKYLTIFLHLLFRLAVILIQFAFPVV